MDGGLCPSSAPRFSPTSSSSRASSSSLPRDLNLSRGELRTLGTRRGHGSSRRQRQEEFPSCSPTCPGARRHLPGCPRAGAPLPPRVRPPGPDGRSVGIPWLWAGEGTRLVQSWEWGWGYEGRGHVQWAPLAVGAGSSVARAASMFCLPHDCRAQALSACMTETHHLLPGRRWAPPPRAPAHPAPDVPAQMPMCQLGGGREAGAMGAPPGTRARAPPSFAFLLPSGWWRPFGEASPGCDPDAGPGTPRGQPSWVGRRRGSRPHPGSPLRALSEQGWKTRLSWALRAAVSLGDTEGPSGPRAPWGVVAFGGSEGEGQGGSPQRPGRLEEDGCRGAGPAGPSSPASAPLFPLLPAPQALPAPRPAGPHRCGVTHTPADLPWTGTGELSSDQMCPLTSSLAS